MDNMDNRNKFWKGVMLGVLVTAFVCLVTVGTSVGIYMFGRRVIDNQVQVQAESQAAGPAGEAKKETLDMDEVEKTLTELQYIVGEAYLFEEKADVEKEKSGIYNGYLFGLDDPYAAYYSPKELAKFVEDTTGTYCGIGAQVSQNIKTGIVTVTRVFEGSPAAEAGMLPGDIIYAVGEQSAMTIDLDILVDQYIRGEEGSKVTVTVFREKDNEYKDLIIERRILDVQTVSTELLENGVGYMEVTSFDTVTAKQFQEGIEKLNGEGMKKLVIDLRNNPGGDLEAVVYMCDYVLEDGKVIVSIVDKKGNKEIRKSKDGHSLDLPIVILVNGNSASASEVFTGALKDHKAASVVGTTTFGKGIVQQLYRLSDGGGLKLTMAHYYTPGGTDIHGKGIDPDVKVELNEDLVSLLTIPKDQDNQLQEALKVIGDMN